MVYDPNLGYDPDQTHALVDSFGSTVQGVPLVGPLMSNFMPGFQSPYAALEGYKMRAVGSELDRYRQLQNQAIRQAQQSQYDLMQPLNAKTGELWGDSAMMNLQAPQLISPEMRDVGNPNDILDPANLASQEERDARSLIMKRSNIEKRQQRRRNRRARRKERRERRQEG